MEFKVGDKVIWEGLEDYGIGTVIGHDSKGYPEVRFENYGCYDDSEILDCHTPSVSTLELVGGTTASTPESPNHYSRLKALTGVETWDILDFVAGDDPDMWNLGKYWFRMGHKEGQSTLTEKKKMLEYLKRSIAKEEAV